MVKSQSPGPIYMVPPTVGYKGHDGTRYRNPQYTMAQRLPSVFGGGGIGPGPVYQVSGMTEHGKDTRPAFTLASRHKELAAFNGPGPGTYSPELSPRMREPRPPAYTMSPRNAIGYQSIGPGPLAYNLPSMLGPKVPNKRANGAYTMTGRYNELTKADTPGPAGYGGINGDVYKHKQPKYTMSPRWAELTGTTMSPGPAGYALKKLPGRDMPKYSMGQRLDMLNPYITADDNMPCIER